METSAPRVGVGVIVLRGDRVLVGRRQGSHGAGTWALPGGHLETGETVEDCAIREVNEETGLAIRDPEAGPWSSDLIDGKHYVTLFVVARSDDGEPLLLEPDKCTQWRWCCWSDLPQPLFPPLASLRAAGFVPAGAAS